MAGEHGDPAAGGGAPAGRAPPAHVAPPPHVTAPVVAVAGELPGWASLVRAPNPGPMTLDGTNTWVLRAGGAAGAVVIDPGPADEEHLRAVAAAAGPVAAVLVTHHHPDHVDGLDRFRALTGAPVAAPPAAGEALAGLRITPLRTPGHTADSVCFLAEPVDPAGGRDPSGRDGRAAVLTGDTILGRGTAVVAWPDGDLGDYLASLRRLTAYSGLPALPGHGPALADCAGAAAYYLAHRRARLDQVRAVVAAGATTPAEVVAAVYPDLDRELRPAAEWSVRAHLAYLSAHPGGARGEPPEGRESPGGAAPLDPL